MPERAVIPGTTASVYQDHYIRLEQTNLERFQYLCELFNATQSMEIGKQVIESAEQVYQSGLHSGSEKIMFRKVIDSMQESLTNLENFRKAVELKKKNRMQDDSWDTYVDNCLENLDAE